MLRGYIRERAKGPSVDEQRKALAKAGVSFDGDYPPVYTDMIQRRTRKALDNHLPQRFAAIKSLRHSQDKIVVYDLATLGTTENDIKDAIAATGERDAVIVVCNPSDEFRWHPDVTKVLGKIADAGKILDTEKRRVRTGAGPMIGRPKKLFGDALDYARDLWGKAELSSKQVAAQVKEETGVDVSVRTLLLTLGHKMDAVERTQRTLRRQAVTPPKRQPKHRKKRRVVKEKPSET